MNSDGSNLDQLKNLINQSLQRYSKEEASGLTQDSEEILEKRLIEIEKRSDDFLIHIASDGLNLDNKIFIEKKLLQDLEHHQDTVKSVSFNFRRSRTAVLDTRELPKPSAVRTSRFPFGLKIDKRAIPGVRDVIAIASGKGGVGKSTVSVNLAIALCRLGKRVGLLDADIYGPSAPTMLKVAGSLAMGNDQKIQPKVSYGLKFVSFGFLSDALNPVLWRGPLVAKAIEQFCFDVAWGDLDFLIVDMPPGTGDVQIALMERIPLHGAIIVSSPQDVALIDAHKALSMFQKLDVPVRGIIENMATHICSHCGHEDAIFGSAGIEEFSKLRGVPVLAKIPLHRAVCLSGDEGRPIVTHEDHPIAETFINLARGVIESSV
jgi:ATP-binding protein involved in chromosome partitioning